MGLLKYVNNQINKLNDLSLPIFRSFLSDVDNLRKKNKTINNDIGTYTYDIKDIYNIVINYYSNGKTIRDSIDKKSSQPQASKFK